MRAHLAATAPGDWNVLSHSSSTVEGQRHVFAPVTAAPNKLLLLAGPWRLVDAESSADEPPIELWQPASLARPVDALLQDTRRALRSYRDHLGLDYPLDACRIVLAHDIPFLALCIQGLMLINTDAIERLQTDPLFRASVLTHELGHTWIGGRIDFDQTGSALRPAELLEGLTTYLARTALAHQLPGTDPWDTALDTPDRGLYAGWAERFRRYEARIGAPEQLKRVASLCEAGNPRLTETDLDAELTPR